jgi:uncharacterized protein YigA (DUF484 family)
MARHLNIVADLIEQSMNNTAIAMDELDCDRIAFAAVGKAGEEFQRAIRDGVVTLSETRRVYQALRVAQASVQKCIQLDEADLSLGKEISKGVEMVAQMKGAAVVSGPGNVRDN